MNDTMQVEEPAESQKLYGDNHVDNILLSSPVPPEVEQRHDIESEIKFERLKNECVGNEDAKIKDGDEMIKDEKLKDENIKDEDSTSADEASLKGTDFLKSLLSASTVSTLPVVEKMITTTEVTDEKLNLKKILYQPDTEKKNEKEQMPNDQPINTSDTQVDDDDRRLVIDISDEEKDGTVEKAVNGKSMPTLNAASEDVRKTVRSSAANVPMRLSRQLQRSQHNLLPKSITYSLEPSAETGLRNSVKIDILAPANNQSEVPSSTCTKAASYQSPSKCSTMSSLDELNLISHEIDKQMSKKANETLELLKDFLGGSLEKNMFLTKMNDASETSQADLMFIAKKLIKRHKFELNPNYKEFMKMKFLNFPTSSRDLILYFDNLLPSLNKEKFINMIKFYEIIIKEMLNLNRTKILQYLIDFMVMRKNAQLDLLNYNFQITSAPNLRQPSTSAGTFQLPDSTQNHSERRPTRLHDTSYNFIIRSDPIYLQAGSSFVTNHRDVITCRMSPRIQMRSFERRPFDNNILKGRRIGRRLVRSPEEAEKIQAEFMRTRFPPTPQSEPGTPIHQMPLMRTSTPIIVESDTPPPSLPSEPPSPLQHRILKAHILSNTLIQPPRTERQETIENGTTEQSAEAPTLEATSPSEHPLKRRSSARSLEFSMESNSSNPLQNGQISIQEIQTLNQNGTEIIPTSILKSAATSRRKTVDRDMEVINASEIQIVKRFLPRVSSHEEQVKPTQPAAPKMPKRRQSCHERIMMSAPNKPEDEMIENSTIGKNYMEFLDMYESAVRKKTENLPAARPTQLQFAPPLHAQPKRVRFSTDADAEIPRSPRNHQQQIIYPITNQQQQQQQQQHQQQMQQQLQQQQQHLQHQQHQHQMDRQRMAQFQAQRSPMKPHAPPINYQYYQHQFERELRERGFDHHDPSLQEPNRPLELVSHVPPERYHQHEQQRALYANHPPQPQPPKQVRHMQEKPPPMRVQQRMSNEAQQQAAMMAAAYHQLQSLHRDTSTLTAQQYAEHLKQLDHLKHIQPSAFSAYQRNPRPMEEQRPPPDYYANTQEVHQQQASSPAQYQISSSSSREDSPNGYEMMHQEPSLQRKLKYKAKSSKYVEPNQLTKPFYNPAHSTYYSEPFALTKNKPATTESPANSTAFHPIEHQRPRSPIPRSMMESAASNQHYQWMVAQAHAQNLALHNQPQRPIPRPPVPTFIESKVNGSTQLHPAHYPDAPTEFLRSFYANPNHKTY